MDQDPQYTHQHTGEGDCLTYTELVTVLAGVVNITNDQLLGAKLQTTVDYLDYILVTVNQLPKGHTSPSPPKDYEMDDNENLAQCGKHQAELLSVRFNAVYLEESEGVACGDICFSTQAPHQSGGVRSM